MYLPKAYSFIGSISIGTLHRWVRAFEKHESTECLQPKNCTLNDITQLMDIEPSVLEVILLFLSNENKIQEKDGIYSVIEELPTKNGIESKNLKLMFIGSNLDYAAIHQLGGDAGRGKNVKYLQDLILNLLMMISMKFLTQLKTF